MRSRPPSLVIGSDRELSSFGSGLSLHDRSLTTDNLKFSLISTGFQTMGRPKRTFCCFVAPFLVSLNHFICSTVFLLVMQVLMSGGEPQCCIMRSRVSFCNIGLVYSMLSQFNDCLLCIIVFLLFLVREGYWFIFLLLAV